jgi:hypothetical protein
MKHDMKQEIKYFWSGLDFPLNGTTHNLWIYDFDEENED